MATLEKIRQRPKLLLIILGAALLAFILTFYGEISQQISSLFGCNPGTTIASVDGHRIDLMEFQNRVNARQQQTQAMGQNPDIDQVQQAVLSEMIAETLFEAEAKSLGLVVTDAELSDMMLGEGASMLNMRIAQESQGQITSAKQLYDMAYNPGQFGLDAATAAQFKEYWKSLEREMEQQLLHQKFNNLFAGTLVASDLDARSLYADAAGTYNIVFAQQLYSTLPDDKYAVTDDEIQGEWERTRARYRINEENRTVSYITVSIVPSDADRAQGKKAVEDAMAELRKLNGAEGIIDNPAFIVSTVSSPASAITDKQAKAYMDSAAVGGVTVTQRGPDDYTLYKLLGKTTAVDSVNVDFFVVEGASARDSIMAGLNSGAIKAADLATNTAVQGVQDSLWVTLSMEGIDSNLKQALADHATGTYFTPDSASTEGGRVFRINNRRAPVAVYDYVVGQYTIEPSATTVNGMLSELNKYVTNNNTSQAFTDNAAKAGYQVVTDVLTPSSLRLGSLKDSKSAVYWAMEEGKKGQVSPVLGGPENGYYVAVAIDNVYDGDYVPYTEPKVKEFIEAKLRNDKKAAELIARYNGKAADMAGYAKLMGATVDSTTVNFGQPMIPKIGMAESKLTASVVTAPLNKIQAPVQGNQGVVVYMVTSVDQNGRPYVYEEASMQYPASGMALLQQRKLDSILRGRKSIDNNILYFYRD